MGLAERKTDWESGELSSVPVFVTNVLHTQFKSLQLLCLSSQLMSGLSVCTVISSEQGLPCPVSFKNTEYNNFLSCVVLLLYKS